MTALTTTGRRPAIVRALSLLQLALRAEREIEAAKARRCVPCLVRWIDWQFAAYELCRINLMISAFEIHLPPPPLDHPTTGEVGPVERPTGGGGLSEDAAR